VAEPTQGGASDFPPTLWTVVRRGGAGSGEALESLCKAYRVPLVSFVRRNWSDPQDAEDLTHGFIAELIRQNDLALRDYLPGASSPPARELSAASLGISVDTLNSRVSRLRAAFKDLVSDEIRQTLLHPDDFNAEQRHFASVPGRQREH
jgi:hypothetical protein